MLKCSSLNPLMSSLGIMDESTRKGFGHWSSRDNDDNEGIAGRDSHSIIIHRLLPVISFGMPMFMTIIIMIITMMLNMCRFDAQRKRGQKKISEGEEGNGNRNGKRNMLYCIINPYFFLVYTIEWWEKGLCDSQRLYIVVYEEETEANDNWPEYCVYRVSHNYCHRYL